MKWNEVLELPIGTKVRLPWWNVKHGYSFGYLKKLENGTIIFRVKYNDGTEVTKDMSPEMFIQDQWEIYHEDEPTKEYITGLEAIKAVYEGKKVYCDHKDWDFGYLYLYENYLTLYEGTHLDSALYVNFFNMARWVILK